MFGYAGSTVPLEYRLDHLESAVFHMTYPQMDPNQRLKQLSETLMGAGAAPVGQPSQPWSSSESTPGSPGNASGAPASQIESHPLADTPDYQKQLPRDELEKFALQLVNEERAQNSLSPLVWSEVGHEMGRELIEDLVKRNSVSHQNSKGENPDRRYTKAGGKDAVLESLVSLKTPVKPVPNKALVIRLLDIINGLQDDRESLLSPHATDLSFSFNWSSDRQHIIACMEVITRHAFIEPIASEASVGDRVDVKGVISGPYKFQKITLAWEGLSSLDTEAEEQTDEALPYFPPLDYEAHAQKSEHDWEKGARLLQMGGIGLALAGGLFIPPVALAAPLIAASGSAVRPKAVSEIPVRGGVKVDGSAFAHKVSLSNGGKEGIYYITIWATTGSETKPVAVSRRAIIVRGSDVVQPTPPRTRETSSEKPTLPVDGQETHEKSEK